MCSLRKPCQTVEILSQKEREALEEEGGKGEEVKNEVFGIRQVVESSSNQVIAKNQVNFSQYCAIKRTNDNRCSRREEEGGEKRSSVARSLLIVNKFEWLLMEIISWIFVANIDRISRACVRWTAYRKLRRCKSQTFVDNLTIVYSSLLNRTITSGKHKRQNDLSERKQVVFDRKQTTNSDTFSDTSHLMREEHRIKHRGSSFKFLIGYLCILLSISCCLYNELSSSIRLREFPQGSSEASLVYLPLVTAVDASLIIGDSAIEIQEVGDPNSQQQNSPQSNNNHNGDTDNHNIQQQQQQQRHQDLSNYEEPSLILGSTSGSVGSIDSQLKQAADSVLHSQKPPVSPSGEQQQQQTSKHQHRANSVLAGPLPPIAGSGNSGAYIKEKLSANDDITDGDKKSRGSHDYNVDDLNGENNDLSKITSAQPAFDDRPDDKAITGKVVDFELTPAGGHNKAKIKRKKKKKKKKEEEEFKKWNKKKKSEKKAHDKKMKESMKKKKEEGKKKKKKWGVEEHGQKKKGKFKKKKWGKKVKKGKGVKKGKKGKKFLKDKGHKNTGFKNVYHKEEWGKSSKWHDIKREKKWDEKSKKWKKKWKKEKGKKYKGDHMKKFKKEKKSGKKYKKEKKEKFKKSKKEEFKKGKKEKMEEHAKNKEGGMKKEKKEDKKKKKKKG